MRIALAVVALLLGPNVQGSVSSESGFLGSTVAVTGVRGRFLRFVSFGPAPLQAHDYWLDGHPVDPITKRLCCGENDCRRLRDDEIEQVSGGWRIRDDDGAWHLVETGRAKPSPDGAAWRCIWGGQVQCLFLPMTM